MKMAQKNNSLVEREIPTFNEHPYLFYQTELWPDLLTWSIYHLDQLMTFIFEHSFKCPSSKFRSSQRLDYYYSVLYI